MKTAIDWLIEQTRTTEWSSLKRGEIIEIAKEKEKQQIIDAKNDSLYDFYNGGEQYYSETFKND